MKKLRPGYFANSEFNEHSPDWLKFRDDVPAVERFLQDIHGGKGKRCSWYYIDLSKKRDAAFLKHAQFNWAQKYTSFFMADRREVYFDLCPSVKMPVNFKTKPGYRMVWRRGQPYSFILDLDMNHTAGMTKSEIHTHLDLICENLKIPYTHLVDTRNGFHVYWVISEAIPEAYWKAGQRRLAEIFKSCGAEMKDSIGVCPRLPYTNHWKSNSNPYLLSVKFKRQMPYSLLTFLETIKDPNKNGEELDATNKKVFKREVKSNLEGTGLNRKDQIGDALLTARQDGFLLADYLGVPFGKSSSFCCPFHDDETPSAGIFRIKNGNYGVYMFNCQSTECGVKGDIINLIKRKEHLQDKDLIRRVLELSGREDLLKYGIQGNISYLDQNLILLEDFLVVIKFYNHGTKKWLRRFSRQLNDIAKMKVRNSEGTFPASFKEIAGGKDSKGVLNKVRLLRLVGLLVKAEIPEACKESQRLFKIRSGALNDTSWHHIPEWTKDVLGEAFKILNEAQESGINTKSCTYEQVAGRFGIEAAARVFQHLPRYPENHLGVSSLEEPDGLSEVG